MKLRLILLFVSFIYLSVEGQNAIIYDLDTYKRVDGQYRTTLIRPDANLNYKNVINNPSLAKTYQISLGGTYSDNRIENSRKNQKRINKHVDFGLTSGTVKNVALAYRYDSNNRSYNNMKYSKIGYNTNTRISYSENANQNQRYTLTTDLNFDLGFGFGRLEIINNAWFGARILEELLSKGLLTEIPSADEMKMFFDLIGDLDFERVMDNRLRSINRIEKMIGFVEQKGWIEKGSIPAFVTIYDAFLFENFIFRQSGERLEFTLKPIITANFSWLPLFDESFSKLIQPGFHGNVEYEIHKNGDLKYYTSKLLGGRIGYFEKFQDSNIMNSKMITGDLYFTYRYRYIPSLRTNLRVSSNISGGFVYYNGYEAILSANITAEYNYYFSPATRLVLEAQLLYRDTEFQIGDYQPKVDAKFSINVVHLIR